MRAVQAQAILEAVAGEFRLPVEKLLGPSRQSVIVHARRVVARTLAEAGASRTEIGIVLRRDRTTVVNLIYGRGHVENARAA